MHARRLTLAFALLTLGLSAGGQVFEPGDLVIPGSRKLDPYGSANGCFYRLRDGQITRWFESTKYKSPQDMVVDSQGRLVFHAWLNSGNQNDSGLFRLDPASGVLERLFRFPYSVTASDTLPNGAESVTSMYNLRQSLHLEKSLAVEINDDENGGWPQVSQPECYGFSIGATSPSGALPNAYRWRNDDDRCEVGVSLGLLPPYTSSAYMAEGDGWIYYGQISGNLIGRAKPHARLSVSLDGDWGSFNASMTATPKNELWNTAYVFDNTTIPNGFVDCGSLQDSNVPFNVVGGYQFHALQMNGLGLLDGALYATSNSAAVGGPYVFSIAGRAPFLNPYNCQYNPAMQGNAPLSFNLPDGTPTAARYTRADGGALIGNELGVIHRVTPAGDHSIVVTNTGDELFTGRPWRWTGSEAKQIASKTTPGSQVLMLRADALVHVLLTDGLGQRIGFDAAGNPINDFGAAAQTIVGPSGWPKILVLSEPQLGISSIEVHATAAGDWGVQAYLAHESAGGTVAATAGTAAGSESLARTLYLTDPLGLSWHLSPTDVELPETARVAFVAGPVPSQGKLRFAFRAPDSGARVELAVYDLRGRRVALPITSTLLAGPQSLDWNGRGSDGRSLARGVYMARLSIDGKQHTQRIVFTR